jgi:hypothetical protein
MKYAVVLVALVALLGADAFRKSYHQFCMENAWRLAFSASD